MYVFGETEMRILKLRIDRGELITYNFERQHKHIQYDSPIQERMSEAQPPTNKIVVTVVKSYMSFTKFLPESQYVWLSKSSFYL